MNISPTGRGPANWIRALDRILRGQATSLPELQDGAIRVPVGGLSVVLIVLAALYGFSAGWYSLFNRPDGPSIAQLFSSTVKMPLLFLLTLVVTFPSLYVFNVLVGSRLTMISLIRLLLAGMAVMLAVLASFGTIVAFFSVTTKSYHFMSLLNVLCCSMAGIFGMAFLLQTLHRLTLVTEKFAVPSSPPPPEQQEGEPGQPPSTESNAPKEDEGSGSAVDEGLKPGRFGPLEHPPGHVLGRHTKTVFRCWMILFALVGGQMSWVLRPFIGDPNLPFEFLRVRESNFFGAVWRTLIALFSISDR